MYAHRFITLSPYHLITLPPYHSLFKTLQKCTYSVYSCITLFLVCFSCFPRTRTVSGPYYLRILTLGLDTALVRL